MPEFNLPLYSLLLLVGAFLVSYILLPKIRSLANVSNFKSIPNARSSHSDHVPNIGGVAFYVTLMLSFYFIEQFDDFDILPTLLPGLTILFIIGLKDDLVMVAPSTKLFAQIGAACFLASHKSFEFINLKGFLWQFDINPIVGFFLVIVIVIVVINAINLIDGIDGLAGIIGLIIFSSFSIIFSSLNYYFMYCLNLIMIGSILAFLRYNFSKEKRIFMGDTGSMIMGFMIAVNTIRLFTLPKEIYQVFDFPLQNFPFIIFAIISVPMLDTFRVFTIRIWHKRSPFEADKNHIHHFMLKKLKGSHKKSSLAIGLLNLFIIGIYILAALYMNQSMIFVLTFILIFLTFIVFNSKPTFDDNNKKVRKKHRMFDFRKYDKALFLLLLIALNTSCGTNKKIVYFSNKDADSTTTSNDFQVYSPVLKIDDYLTINVMDIDLETVSIFNLHSFTPASQLSGYTNGTAAINGYLIDRNGMINMPVLGRIKIAGLHRDEAVELIETELKKYLKSPVVNLQILNYKITVLGEVNMPGTFRIPNERITILEAIGLAGDLKMTGKRKNVLVVREENGKRQEFIIDLTSEKLFTSPVYYLHQNDVIYVEPNRASMANSTFLKTNATIFVSLASLIVSTLILVTR